MSLGVKRSKLMRYDPRHFLFGETQQVINADMRALLERNLVQFTPEGEQREVIIVGHGVHADIAALRKVASINIYDQEAFLSIIGIMDTYTMTRHLIEWKKLPKFTGLTLEAVVGGLRIPHHHRSFHVSGNDANFAMKVMLSMFVHSLGDLSMDETLKTRTEMLEAIAMAPIVQGFTPDQLKYREWIIERKVAKTVARKELQAKRPEDWISSMEDDGLGILLD